MNTLKGSIGRIAGAKSYCLEDILAYSLDFYSYGEIGETIRTIIFKAADFFYNAYLAMKKKAALQTLLFYQLLSFVIYAIGYGVFIFSAYNLIAVIIILSGFAIFVTASVGTNELEK